MFLCRKHKDSPGKGSTEMCQIKKLLCTCITNLEKWQKSGGNHSKFVKCETLQLEGATKLLKEYLETLLKPFPKKSNEKSKVIIYNLCKKTFIDEESKPVILNAYIVRYISVPNPVE